MSLVTYDQAKKYAPLIKYRTGLFPKQGTMPPYYLERNVGIQQYSDDVRLTEDQIATLAAWADAGAPEGDAAKMPPRPDLSSDEGWTIHPDIIVKSNDLFMEGGHPDWWGEIDPIPIPLDEDRYVKAVQVREVNDVPKEGTGGGTHVGGRWIVHHMIYHTEAENDEGKKEVTPWPVHELGRNADIFDPDGGPLLAAHSEIVSNSVHMHSNGRDTHANLLIGFELFPKGYKPKYKRARLALGDGQNLDVPARSEGESTEFHAYAALKHNVKFQTFEPHLHVPGERMCLEYIWGTMRETLSCVGYDHNWVKQYTFKPGYEPLIPKGAIVHIVGYNNNTKSNAEIPDPRNWQGSGNRSVQNMFIDLGRQLQLTDEQFKEAMEERVRERGLTKNDHVVGCPLCLATIPTPGPKPREAMKAKTGQQDDDQGGRQ